MFKSKDKIGTDAFMPLSSGQAIMSVLLTYRSLLEKAAEENDSLKRLAYVLAHIVSQGIQTKGQKLAAMGMTGETYELVTDEFRYVSEML